MEEIEEMLSLIDKINRKSVAIKGSFYTLNGFEFFGETAKTYKEIQEEFEDLFQNWVESIKNGKELNKKLRITLENEINRLKHDGGFNPGATKIGISRLGVLYEFLDKIKYLDFEYELVTKKINRNACNCLKRIKYSIEPQLNFLNHIGYGLDLYDKFKIYSCLECKTKWIHYNSEDDVVSMKWKRWNAKEFPWEKQ